MNTAMRLGGFAGLLTAAFAASALAGDAIDPDPTGTTVGHDAQAMSADAHPAEDRSAASGAHGTAAASDRSPATVRGLAVSDSGYTLRLEREQLRAGVRAPLDFRIVDSDDEPVTEFDAEHERRMHLIVVRRDVTGFQHLHPRMGADGTWSTKVRLDRAGSYRVFADFTAAGSAVTLGADLAVDGDADYRPLPESASLADAGDGYSVRLEDGPLRAGAPATLDFTVHKDGRAVHPEPYLGAGGHLVALRARDLAFLHTHPAEQSDAAGDRSGAVAFASTFPSSGRYGLFLQFKAAGQVRTAAFTVEVGP